MPHAPFGEIEKHVPYKPPFNCLAGEWFCSSDIGVTSRIVRKVERLLRTDYSYSSRIFLQYYLVLLLTGIRGIRKSLSGSRLRSVPPERCWYCLKYRLRSNIMPGGGPTRQICDDWRCIFTALAPLNGSERTTKVCLTAESVKLLDVKKRN